MPAIKDVPRILVVDDDESNLKLFREILLRKSYYVDDAASGEIALEKIAVNRYDLVVTDLHMYRVDGLDVLEAAKRKDGFCEVLILTGFGTVTSAVDAMKQGAYEYLPKPIDHEAFLVKVNNALEHRRMLMLVEEQQKKIDEVHQLIDRDLKLAKRVHQSLIPDGYENERCVVSVEYLPLLDIGGDFVDIYDNHQGQLYLSTIDVTGHGITAALMVNRLCSEIQKLVRDNYSPREMLYHLNQFFYNSFAQTGLFLSIMSVMIDYQTGVLVHAGSAHPAGLYYDSQMKSLKRLIPQNIIIGFDAVPLAQFSQQTIEMHSGDGVVMFTDGLVEVENKDQIAFGTQGLKNCLQQVIHRSVSDVTHSIIDEIRAFGGEDRQDDVLLVIARLK